MGKGVNLITNHAAHRLCLSGYISTIITTFRVSGMFLWLQQQQSGCGVRVHEDMMSEVIPIGTSPKGGGAFVPANCA